MPNYIPKNREYSLEKYSPEWALRFEALRIVFQEVFKDTTLQIEHIGSTSIVGMTSKPIVDVLIVVEDFSDFEGYIRTMHSQGYEHKKDYVKKDSYFFFKEIDGKRKENIHVFPKNHPHITELLDKRNYLRTHPEEAQRYASIKADLATKYPNDYVSYRKGKDGYLNNELHNKVIEWKRKDR